MLDQGLIKTIDGSKWNHVLWNVIGSTSTNPTLELYKGRLEPGDLILLCTDGLTKHLSEDQMTEVLLTARSADEQCRILVNQANSAGGTDNVTCALARFDDRSKLKSATVEANARGSSSGTTGYNASFLNSLALRVT